MLFLIFVILILCIIFPPLQVILFHPFKTVRYAVVDIYDYFKKRKWNYLEAGKLTCYFAPFGGGKTLSAVEHVTLLYNQYNNKKVWDNRQNKFVTQKVHILSNVDIKGVSCEKLENLSQIVNYSFKIKDIDEKCGTRTVTIVLLDEASAQLNSRNFKDNINAEFLNTLITSRHFNMNMYYTSQKFKLTDALLRNVTQTCIHCRKFWRIVVTYHYDADQLELAGDVQLVHPYIKIGYFATDKLFNSYDTYATVDQLKKSFDKKDLMSEAEILTLRGQLNPDLDAVTSPSRKLRKMRKRK